ncbi:hypothetical protein ACSQ67_009883 [Phaseolus vulgaris]
MLIGRKVIDGVGYSIAGGEPEDASATNDGHLSVLLLYGVPPEHAQRASSVVPSLKAKVMSMKEASSFTEAMPKIPWALPTAFELSSGPSVMGSSIMKVVPKPLWTFLGVSTICTMEGLLAVRRSW